MVPVVKNLSASGGDGRVVCSISRSGRSPEGGHRNSLQYSCLENPMDRRADGLSMRAGMRAHPVEIMRVTAGEQGLRL